MKHWEWVLVGIGLGLWVGCGQGSPSPKTSGAKPSEPSVAAAPTEQPAGSVQKEALSSGQKEPPQASTPPLKEIVQVPLGLPPLPIPADNPMTPEKVALGRMLYFDKRLSRDGTISCATCHDPQKAWAEDTPVSTGFQGQKGQMNSPTVINTAYATSLFWDGRAASLEDQALGPMQNPIEMAHDLDALVQQLSKIPKYVEMFQKVFGTGVTKEGMAKAIAAFERTVLSGNSPYDRYTKANDPKALTDVQKRGMKLFEQHCDVCHTPPLFSNYRFLNAGIGMDQNPPPEGRKSVTGKEEDLGKFRVPPLREVAKTSPYFHNGSAATLEEAVAVMAAGGKDNPHLSPMMKAVREAKLTEQDRQDLVEFLKALSGEYPIIEPPQLP